MRTRTEPSAAAAIAAYDAGVGGRRIAAQAAARSTLIIEVPKKCVASAPLGDTIGLPSESRSACAKSASSASRERACPPRV